MEGREGERAVGGKEGKRDYGWREGERERDLSGKERNG